MRAIGRRERLLGTGRARHPCRRPGTGTEVLTATCKHTVLTLRGNALPSVTGSCIPGRPPGEARTPGLIFITSPIVTSCRDRVTFFHMAGL